MSDVLHMEIDSIIACAFQLRTESERIRHQAQALAVSARTVDWYGTARETFQYELEQITIDMVRLADECDVLAARANREVGEWQQTDAYFSQQFMQIIIPNFIKG